MIVDFHTHAFPDSIADRAMTQLQHEGKITAALDGHVSSLLKSMDICGIERAVVVSIATKPDQFASILKWSGSIRTERLIPFPSIHPTDPAALAHIDEISRAGFKGIKLHPYYQDFVVDDPALDPIYRRITERGLLLLVHTGFDFAFPRRRIADPIRIRRVVDRHPDLKFVATHLGAWADWSEVRQWLIGRPIYLELSFSLQYMTPELAFALLTEHPAEYLLFGTDSPWVGQAETLAHVRALHLPAEREAALLGGNAQRLL
jgi:predicted TIM-barrel fold metal-dependent hydrolase